MGATQQVIRLSIFFLILATSTLSYISILTHIYENQGIPGLGPATLTSIYGAFIVSSFLAPAVRLSFKTQFIIAGICHTNNFSTGIYVLLIENHTLKIAISCSAAALSGFSSGLLWLRQGRYIDLVCRKFKTLDKKGQMCGLFYSIFTSSIITAGLITTFGLGFFDDRIYFMILTAFGALATLYCILFVKNIQSSQLQISTYQRQKLINQQPNDLRENRIQLQPLTPQYSVLQSVKNVFRFIPVMYAILPVFLIEGFSFGFFSTQIVHCIPNYVEKSVLNKIAGITTLILGVGSSLGSLVSGKLADKVGTLISGRLAIMFWLISIGTVILALVIQQLWITFIAAFMWGYSLFFIASWLLVACSREYQAKSEAFSTNKILHSLFYIFFQIPVIVTGNKISLIPMVSIASIVAIPALYFLNKLPKQTHNQLNEAKP